MERFTKKNEFFEYVLPEQNIFGDNQATEISLVETEYTCKLHIAGEAIKRFGELEDVLEEFELTSAEDLRNYLNFQDNMGTIWESKLDLKNKIAYLNQELAELKQKAIVPKFKVGQEIYVIDDYFRVTSAIIERITICRENSISEGETSYVHYLANLGEKYEWDERYLMLYGEEISLTKEEAEQKLAEIKGEKDE